MNDTLQEFVDGLIEERGLAESDSEAQDELRAEMFSQLSEAVHASMESNLDEDGLKDLEALRDEGDEDAIALFYERVIPRYEEILEEEMQRFKDTSQL